MKNALRDKEVSISPAELLILAVLIKESDSLSVPHCASALFWDDVSRTPLRVVAYFI